MELSFFFFYLGALFILTFIGNGLLPLPITAYVLWLGQFHMPVPIVLVATLGTVLGARFMEPVFQKIIQSRSSVHQVIPRYYHAFFQKQPGLCIFVFNALPFPWDPSRVLAHLHGYPPSRLLGVLAIGRLFRYSLLVVMGAVLARYQVIFVLVLVAVIAIPILMWGLAKLKLALTSKSAKLEAEEVGTAR